MMIELTNALHISGKTMRNTTACIIYLFFEQSIYIYIVNHIFGIEFYVYYLGATRLQFHTIYCISSIVPGREKYIISQCI